MAIAELKHNMTAKICHPVGVLGTIPYDFAIIITSLRDFEIGSMIANYKIVCDFARSVCHFARSVCELQEAKTCILTLKGCNSYSKSIQNIDKNPERVTESETGKYKFDSQKLYYPVGVLDTILFHFL